MKKPTFKKNAVAQLSIRTALRAGANPMICAELGKRCSDACKRIDEHLLDLRMGCFQNCGNAQEACLSQ